MVVAFEFLPVFILILATGHMIFIARKHAREVAFVAAQLQYNHPTAEGGTAAPLRQENRRGSSVLFIAAIVLFFVFCYSVTIALSFCSIFELCAVPRALAPVKTLFLIANSAFNPFAYGFLKHKSMTSKGKLSNSCVCKTWIISFNWLTALPAQITGLVLNSVRAREDGPSYFGPP